MTDLERQSWQIRFGGMGGQGVVTLGDTLSYAASLAGWHAAASTVYGAQARGGASRSDVRLSRELIDYPLVESPDVLVVLSREAYHVYCVEPTPPLIIIDSTVIPPPTPPPSGRVVSVEATRLALEVLGRRQSANFVMLGALVGVTRLLDLEDLVRAVEQRMSPLFNEANRRALEAGISAIAG